MFIGLRKQLIVLLSCGHQLVNMMMLEMVYMYI